MGSNWTLLVWVAVFGIIIYFFMIRPGKKRTDDQRNMMNALQPGTRVMLTSGIFGTIETMGEQQVVIELAPGTSVTVVKQAIAKVLAEADEEFEYADADAIEASDDKLELTDGTEDKAEDTQSDVQPDVVVEPEAAVNEDASADEAKK